METISTRARYTNRLLPIDTSFCAKALGVAFKTTILESCPTWYEEEKQQKNIAEISEWLTTRNYKYGILLQGVVGNGKTTILRSTKKLVDNLNLDDPVESYSAHREQLFLRVWNAMEVGNIYLEDRKRFERFKMASFVGIDDLGVENETLKHYGNSFSPISELILYRYENKLPTIITTNLLIEQIENIYGVRISERILEMMLKINFSDYNFRRKHIK